MSTSQPDPQEIERRLRNLTQRQCQILYWVGRGLVYKQIARHMGCGQDLIQLEMSRVYKTLGLRHLETNEKRRLLNTLICPIHQKMVRNPETDCVEGVIEPEPSPPAPDEVKEVIEDEKRGMIPLDTSLISVSQSSLVELPQEKYPQVMMTRRANPLPWIVVGVLATLLCIAMIAIVWLLTQQPSTVAQRPITIVVTATQPPQATPINATQPSPLPTYTALPTYTPFPSLTPVPPPSSTPKAIFSRGQVMFTDDFERGISPAWKFPSGNWITANRRLTAQYNGNVYEWLWAVIDQPDWTNYLVSVDANMPFFGSMAQQPIAIAVRVTSSQKKYLAFYCDHYCGWSYVEASDAQFISGNYYDGVEKGVYEIEAIGNQFVARINGRESQRISLTGYDSGGIALGMKCNYSLGCPSFDNLKITGQ